jgi:hypothetical protein
MNDPTLPHAIPPEQNRPKRGTAFKLAIWALFMFLGATTGFGFALYFNGMNGDLAPSAIKAAMVASIVTGALLGLLVGNLLMRWRGPIAALKDHLKLQFSKYRWLIAIGSFAIGWAVLIPGWQLQTSHGKTNQIDDLSWLLILAGLFLLGFAVGSLTGRLKTAFWFGMSTPAILYVLLYVAFAVGH